MKQFAKKILASIIGLMLGASFIVASAAEEYSWYIRRNGHEIPGFPSGAEALSDYSAYYMDNKAYECGEKVLYLTFDAGYENGNISKILDTLKEENVSAAFFILDNIIYKTPELVKRMADEGHLVCNHTKKHKNLCNSSIEEIEKDLKALEELCEEKTGVTMPKYFRFPEGKYSMEALKSLQELGYKTFFWSFGYDDWDNARQPDKQKSINKILSNTHNGEVILLHPTSATNAEIMGDLIKEWRKMGYSFGTLDQLCEKNSV